MIEWLKEYWWIIIIILIGLFINGIKELNKTSFESYLKRKKGNKPEDKK